MFWVFLLLIVFYYFDLSKSHVVYLSLNAFSFLSWESCDHVCMDAVAFAEIIHWATCLRTVIGVTRLLQTEWLNWCVLGTLVQPGSTGCLWSTVCAYAAARCYCPGRPSAASRCRAKTSDQAIRGKIVVESVRVRLQCSGLGLMAWESAWN